MNGQLASIIQKYFDFQNASDANGVVDLFTEDAEVYNVNLPSVRGREGIRAFCEGLYARTNSRRFTILTVLTDGDTAMAEWEVHMEFRHGAKVGPWELGAEFSVELRGINKFEFDGETHAIKRLRVFHETSTVAELAKKHAANP